MPAKHAGTWVLAVHTKIGIAESVPMRDGPKKGASSALGFGFGFGLSCRTWNITNTRKILQKNEKERGEISS